MVTSPDSILFRSYALSQPTQSEKIHNRDKKFFIGRFCSIKRPKGIMFSTNNQNINTFQPRTICSIDDFCRKTPAHSPIQRTAEVFVKILLLLRQMDNVKKYGLKEQVALLPLSPGVYQFLDKNGTIIYVGKAKSLRKRVSSYFMQNKEHSAKVQVLVRQIAAIRHIVVDTETDALLLENSLIKTLQPRYNILLKDDKTYPWIVVRREPFPRVQSTRVLNRDGSQYFGPYGSVQQVLLYL